METNQQVMDSFRAETARIQAGEHVGNIAARETQAPPVSQVSTTSWDGIVGWEGIG